MSNSAVPKSGNIEHFYQEIEGWFNFSGLYSHMVETAKDGATFVELGAFYGASTAFMAVEIANSNKSIDFHTVDSWEYKPIFDSFTKSIEPVKDLVTVHQNTTDDACALFEDESIDFLFIDACHEYEQVARDIKNWLPKMKPNSVFAGHDYWSSFPGVMQAVYEQFPNSVKVVEQQSWMVQLVDGKAVSHF